MKNSRIVNKNRSKLFGIVINPKLSGTVDWKSMSVSEIGEKLKQLKFLDKYSLMNYLNNLEVKNVSNNRTLINDYVGQLELGTESRIPHYQLAVEMETICTKKRVLESFEEKINAHISVQVQFNFEDMKKYCEKKTEFILPEYSGKICKHEWDMDLLDRRPELRRFMETPFAWQTFLENSILNKTPDDRTVDWIIDPMGNTGKSTFARLYVYKDLTDGIFMKIDNLDRMELTLIKKIEKYRLKYSKDPKVLLFDFPRASDMKKVLAATALMEDAKSGYLETTFGGNHKEIQIGDIHIVVFSNNCPDLSVLSVDRWRLWTLSGKNFDNIIWPVDTRPWIKSVNTRNWNIVWTVNLRCLSVTEIKKNKKYDGIVLPEEWFCKFGPKKIYTNDLSTNVNHSPNFIKIKLASLLNNELNLLSVINFKEYE